MTRSAIYLKKVLGDKPETVNLGTATEPAVEVEADAVIKRILNRKRTPGNTRSVKVVTINDILFEQYERKGIQRPKIGQVFDTARFACLAIGAHPAALTTALSDAKTRGGTVATIRGVSFTFVE